MAVVPDRRISLEHKLYHFQQNKELIMETLELRLAQKQITTHSPPSQIDVAVDVHATDNGTTENGIANDNVLEIDAIENDAIEIDAIENDAREKGTLVKEPPANEMKPTENGTSEHADDRIENGTAETKAHDNIGVTENDGNDDTRANNGTPDNSGIEGRNDQHTQNVSSENCVERDNKEDTGLSEKSSLENDSEANGSSDINIKPDTEKLCISQHDGSSSNQNQDDAPMTNNNIPENNVSNHVVQIKTEVKTEIQPETETISKVENDEEIEVSVKTEAEIIENVVDVKNVDNKEDNIFNSIPLGNEAGTSSTPRLPTLSIEEQKELLKSLESEISSTQQHLNDENEKRIKFKIDDSRRTHNYDQFICTFLSMLAHEGVLGELVEPHLNLPRKALNALNNNKGRLGRVGGYNKGAAKTTTYGKRRRGRNKGTRKK